MEPPPITSPMSERDREITATVLRERTKLGNFIRRRVRDPRDAEDILQDVLHELVQAYRLPEPIEQVSAWLFRVARNRITDLFRRRKNVSLNETPGDADGGLTLEDLLPSPEAGPDAVYARGVLLEELDDAIAELPENQREVFVAHEVLGRSFQEIAVETGVGINTLLSRKRYAVLHLRKRLKEIGQDFGFEDRK
jgi:RNA polymerase sigma factor (sigma-70 family)